MAKVKLLNTEQRYEEGKALRDKCSRLSHGKIILGQGQKRDIVALIKASNVGRLENLISIRKEGCSSPHLHTFGARP